MTTLICQKLYHALKISYHNVGIHQKFTLTVGEWF